MPLSEEGEKIYHARYARNFKNLRKHGLKFDMRVVAMAARVETHVGPVDFYIGYGYWQTPDHRITGRTWSSFKAAFVTGKIQDVPKPDALSSTNRRVSEAVSRLPQEGFCIKRSLGAYGLRVETSEGDVDYWPTSNKWRDPDGSYETGDFFSRFSPSEEGRD